MTRLATSFKRFDKAIADAARAVPNELLSVFHRKIALDALTGIVDNNPVLTGQSRGNWQVSNGSPVEGILNTTDKDGARTKANGNAIINQSTPFGVIYITNNLPYIIPLEEGSSGKAPEGMVAITLDRLSEIRVL